MNRVRITRENEQIVWKSCEGKQITRKQMSENDESWVKSECGTKVHL